MDLKFALRSLRKNPGFTLLAVLVMALGIGANTAVFSVVNAVLLKPLAYRDPDRIVTLSSLGGRAADTAQVSAPDFHDWHDQSTAFAAMAYYDDDSTRRDVRRVGRVRARRPRSRRSSFRSSRWNRWRAALFSRRRAEAGRRAARWSSATRTGRATSGRMPDALGQAVRMLGESFTIVGVLPPQFHFPDETDIWLPANMVFSGTTSRSAHNYRGGWPPEAGRQSGAGAGADDRHRRAPGTAVSGQQHGQVGGGHAHARRDGPQRRADALPAAGRGRRWCC